MKQLMTMCMVAFSTMMFAQTQIGAQVVSYPEEIPIENLEVSTEILLIDFSDISNYSIITSIDTTDSEGLVYMEIDTSLYDLSPIGIVIANITYSYLDCDSSEYTSIPHSMWLYDDIMNPDTIFQEFYCDTAWYNGNCDFVLQVDTTGGSNWVNMMTFNISDLPPDATISFLQEGYDIFTYDELGPSANGFGLSQVPIGDYVCFYVESDYCGDWVDCVGDIPCDSLYLDISEDNPWYDYQFTIVNLPQDGMFTWEITTDTDTIIEGPYTNQINPTASLPIWGVLGQETIYTEDVNEMCIYVTSENCGYDWYQCVEFDDGGDIIESVNEVRFDQNIYPSPTSGTVYFTSQISFVKVYDISGNLVGTFENVSFIDISGYTNGFYIIKGINTYGQFFGKILKI